MAQTEVSSEEYAEEQPLRWYVLVPYVLVIVGGFAITVWCTASWAATCSDIGGKTTSVAGDSTRASLCESAHGAAIALIPAAWILGLVLATLALLRWGGGAIRAVLLAVLFLTPVLLPAAAYGGLHRSGTTCSG
ncbi:MAG TPA: hypothetical protein PLZ93_05065, partial [Nocardioides sp.]|nr:hypothetical protein [Nocardioides sp.]